VRRLAVFALVPLLGLLAACGEDGGGPDVAAAPTSPATSPAAGDLSAIEVVGGVNSAPKVDFETPFRVDKTLTRVLKPGDGPEVRVNSTVLIDYVGINANDGRQFDSSWDRGNSQTFALVPGQMIPGFITGLVGQKVGGRLLVAMPPAEGYGAQGNSQAGISGTDTLLFVVNLLATSDPDPLARAEGSAKDLPAGVPALQTDEQGVPTGFEVTGDAPPAPDELGVYPLISGTGPTVGEGDLLTVHYLGQIFPDGEIFDESWSEGKPVTFQIGAGALISGWDQGLVGQRVGSRLVLVIPPELGYGEEGSPPTIPGGASLIFSVDILGIG